jgi:hypothetical protein
VERGSYQLGPSMSWAVTLDQMQLDCVRARVHAGWVNMASPSV